MRKVVVVYFHTFKQKFVNSEITSKTQLRETFNTLNKYGGAVYYFENDAVATVWSVAKGGDTAAYGKAEVWLGFREAHPRFTHAFKSGQFPCNDSRY